MKSEKWGKWISVLLYVALGGALGWALGNFLSSGQVELPLGEKLLLARGDGASIKKGLLFSKNLL